MKGVTDTLVKLGIGIVTLVVVVTFGLTYLADEKAELTVNSTAYNATVDGEEGLAKISSKVVTIVGIVILVIVIGLLMLLNRGRN